MTLLELMLVMGLMALVLGVGLGSFANMNLGQRTAVSLVQNTLRTARNWAVAHGSSARVRIDATGSVLSAEGTHVIGTWHFEEDPPRGAFGLDGDLFGGRMVDDGFQGKALSFYGSERGARAEFQVQRDPAYDFTGGFALECALRLEGSGGGRIVTIGDVVGLEVTRQGAVRAWFKSQVSDELERAVAGGKVIVESEAGAARPGGWLEVGIYYDRRKLELEIDGLPVKVVEEKAPVWRIEQPLRLSGGSRPFSGSIDNLVISAIAAEEEIELPEGVVFAPEAPKDMRFDPSGRLDHRFHDKPLVVPLVFEDGRREEIHVTLYGTVE